MAGITIISSKAMTLNIARSLICFRCSGVIVSGILNGNRKILYNQIRKTIVSNPKNMVIESFITCTLLSGWFTQVMGMSIILISLSWAWYSNSTSCDQPLLCILPNKNFATSLGYSLNPHWVSLW